MYRLFVIVEFYYKMLSVYFSNFENGFSLTMQLITKKRHVTFFVKDGARFRARSGTLDYLMIKEAYVDGCYIIPGFEINHNDIVIDIGAHIGTFLYSQRKGPLKAWSTPSNQNQRITAFWKKISVSIYVIISRLLIAEYGVKASTI